MSTENARDLTLDLQWFTQVLDTRLKLHFGQEVEHPDIFEIAPPDLSQSDSNWAKLIEQQALNTEERLTILLALIPHIRPKLLDVFFTKNASFDRSFTEFGGYTKGNNQGFIPTLQTCLFLLGSQDLSQRFDLMSLFLPLGKLQQQNILNIQNLEQDNLPGSAVLGLSKEYIGLLTHGSPPPAVFGKDFPAEVIRTELDWSDLVLAPITLEQIKEIETWIEHGDTLLKDWGMAGKIQPGFRALFHGPPGTGKTATASVLGKHTGREVYRIDLSMIASGYIGETEKNLTKIFQQAENKAWILFFDEADALFGKRSEVASVDDRFANQEIAYLFQQLESFNGLAIFASNSKGNIDDTFTRRFEVTIPFPIPNERQRFRIWQQGFSEKSILASDIHLEDIASQFVLSRGAIMNVIRFASLEALRRGTNEIQLANLRTGIRREMMKEGKLLQ